MSEAAGRFFESLVQPIPRPYSERAQIAQRRVRDLLDRLGNPQRTLPCIHVAGSKGKGSTALFAEAILRQLGHKTGTFLSPHLHAWNERFMLSGAPVSDDRLNQTINVLRQPVAELTRLHPDAPPSFFDALTACAFELFDDTGVEFAIIEAGLGGRFDATTVANARVSCISSIEYEHTDKLGETLAEIAGHKAGIIKSGVPVIVGPMHQSAAEVIAEEARSLGAPLVRFGVEFQAQTSSSEAPTRLRFVEESFKLDLKLRTPGALAVTNAALAVQCVRQLLGPEVDHRGEDFARALESVVLPGRTEIMCQTPLVIVDAAHTAASAKGLTTLLKSLAAEQVHLLVSMTAGKQINVVLEELVPYCQQVTVTLAEPSRSIDAEKLARTIRKLAPNKSVRVEPNVRLAVESAYKAIPSGGSLCVAGSVYLAGSARAVLQELLD